MAQHRAGVVAACRDAAAMLALSCVERKGVLPYDMTMGAFLFFSGLLILIIGVHPISQPFDLCSEIRCELSRSHWLYPISRFARWWSGTRRSPTGYFAPVRLRIPIPSSGSSSVRACCLQHLSAAAPTSGLSFSSAIFLVIVIRSAF